MAGSNDLEANNRMSRGSEAVDSGFSEKPLNQGTGSGIHASVYIMYVNSRCGQVLYVRGYLT
jgi:hypothetical protein